MKKHKNTTVKASSNKTLLTFLLGTVIAAFLLFAAANALFFSASPVTANPNAPVLTAPSGDIQTIQLSTNGPSYSPSVITAKLGQTVRLVAANGALSGCARALVIPAFNVRKVFTSSDNVVEFTANQKGSFPFSCSMGMYRGTINVI